MRSVVSINQERRGAATGVLAIAVSLLVVLTSLIALPQSASADTTPTDSSTPATVTTDVLPTVQINGIIWSQVVVGNTVYAAGSFSTARPAGSVAGSNEVTRTNLLAFDITTGNLLSFAPSINGQVLTVAASPDGTRLYIGGDFTSVDGATRNRVAAFNIPAGTLDSSFAPNVNASVRGIAATDSVVFFTGVFGRVSNNDRLHVAAVSSSGTLLPFAPVLDGGRGNAVVISPDAGAVVVGGAFTTANGSSNPGYGLARFDSSSGALLPTGVNSAVRNGGADAAIYSLSTADGYFYGTGYVYGSGGNLEGTFKADWSSGDLVWVEDCHGDTYSSYAVNGVVYAATHAHYCGSLINGHPQSNPWTFYRGVAFSDDVKRITPSGLNLGYYDWGGTPAPEMLHFMPQFNTGTVSGSSQGPWSVTGNDNYVVYGGEFTRVNNVLQQGLVRFAVKSIAPNLDGPRLGQSSWIPSAVAISEGSIRVSWPLNWDRDNEYLTYQVIRNGNTASPVYSVTARSKPADWALPGLTFTDKNVVQGQTYTYRIRVYDPSGNVQNSATITAVADGDSPTTAYSTAVLADDPVSYWPFNDTAGSTSYDWAGASDLTVNSPVTRGVSGALVDETATAARFPGTNDGFAASSELIAGPQTFGIEAWFKTTSTSGGKIVGFGNSNTGTSTSYDRHVYMQPSGAITFGVYPGSSQTISSSKTYNDGQWHHVVAGLGSDGMTLYIDGVRVAARTDITSAQDYSGYWRIGGDTPWAGATWFDGDIDEVAIYDAPLTRSEVQGHYIASGRTLTGTTAPTDAYGAAVYSLEPTLYWRLDEASGATVNDYSGAGVTGSIVGSASRGVAGALVDVADSATRFSGGQAISATSFDNPTVYSLEAWFKTTSTTGGKIIGFGNSADGNSSSYDRHVYMNKNGHLTFGVWTGQTETIDTSSAYNDGSWHHVLATQGADGMALYVDGDLVGTNSTTTPQSYTGYWHVGGDVTWGGNAWEFAGDIDEVAVYPVELSASVAAEHYQIGANIQPSNEEPAASFTTSTSGLTVSVDGSASSDTDGTIASYQWSWGDGTSSVASSDATASHEYQNSGSYEITLTVVDNDGGSDTASAQVAVVAPNAAPIAAFTSSVSGATVSVDASGSTDTDGTVASYSWAWGDGSEPSIGVLASHTYAAGGTYTVTLTVTDDDGATGTKTAQAVVAAPNVAPTAAFTSSVADLTVSVDGSGSTDSDGTVASYSWNWGDQSAEGSGATASHVYSEAGTYSVTLTVTDDDGATNAVTNSVTVTAPAVGSVLAADEFDRTVSSGWGSATTGGAWTLSGTASQFSVAGGAGVISTNAGLTRTASLATLASPDSSTRVDVTFPSLPVGGSSYVMVTSRKNGSSGYDVRAVVTTTGATTLQLRRNGTTLATGSVPFTIAAGDTVSLRLDVEGASPTTLRARAWKAGSSEPTTWLVTTQDSTSGLQVAGGAALGTYVSSTITNTPYSVRFDHYSVTTPGTVVVPNVAPTAAFTSSVADLTVSVDGSGSTDSDGTVASYSWNWGDQSAEGSGATASHVYSEAGTYSVTLTVTDDDGATNAVTNSVTVTAPAVGSVLAADEFDRTVSSGWGSATTGGAWTLSGTASQFSVAGGAGVISTNTGLTRTAYLNDVSSTSTDLTSLFSIDALPTGGSDFVSFAARRVGSSDYQARLSIAAAGSVQLQLRRGDTTMTSVNVSGLTIAANDGVNVRVQVFGTSPTTIRAKVWKAGTTEPTTWNATTTDATAALQSAGGVGVGLYVGSGVTNVPQTVRILSLSAVPGP
ncbi:PKD domain-containing protein [Microbacterium sp.]|uniref:PKD domain-containing protein n=1 Tax=Microbacterium sp. TaxID=51671 RepID=UPI0039E5B90A